MKHLLMLSILLVSCSRLNPQERAAFEQERKLRHGIIPRDPPRARRVAQELQLASRKRGESLYRGLCLECHGERGRGDGPTARDWPVAPPDLMRTLREVPHFELYMAVSQVQGEMPGWRQPLTAADREDLASYLRQLRDEQTP